jgi:hypothetical protein
MREAPSLDELRTWSESALLQARDETVLVERRARLTRVDIDRVLHERGAMRGHDADQWVAARDKVSAQTARGEVEVARALESLPEIRAAADDGRLSMEQLVPLVELATPETDGEWARRAEHTQPSELNRLVRKTRVVSPAEMAERRARRALRWWRICDGQGLRITGEIFDVDAALVEQVLDHEVETLRPAKGRAWAPRVQRGADALVAICRRADTPPDPSGRSGAKRRSWRPTVVVHVGSDAQPTVNGMPIDCATVTTLIDDGARVVEVTDDDPLAPATGDAIPAKLRTYLVGRDTTCRVPGCERSFGLDAHHLIPRCHGGATDRHNLALVCTTHHRQLVPHGPCVLDGDPEHPDGLTLQPP